MPKNKNNKEMPKFVSRPFSSFTRSTYKFDMNKILKERQAESEFWNKNAELDKQIKIVDDLFEKEVNRTNANEENNSILPKIGYVVFDSSKYNIPLNIDFDSDVVKPSERLLKMAFEKNERLSYTHFNCLLKADWLLQFNDVRLILSNWGAELDTLMNKPLLKCQVKSMNIGRHNFTLVLNFISESIKKQKSGFNNSDLLTLAKLTVIISLDHHCGQMINVIKKLFSVCIETALNKEDENAILDVAQELYSRHQDDLLQIFVDLFLPLNGHVLKKMYSYLAFKLYKKLLGLTNNVNPFPTSIKDWFVQDMVNKDYFIQNPRIVLDSVIRLLEHIVFVLDLYEDEEKLNNMYEFLNGVSKQTKLIESLSIGNILDQWRLRLFRLHINSKKDLIWKA